MHHDEMPITLFCHSDKTGVSLKRFYKQLIAKADKRFGDKLRRFRKEGEKVDGEESQ
ncbi:MAG: hypothetical protein PUP93_11510 [Rhizonema sp. NSF051]|nr:hypothetical protein [Rhizonema sp. NSF051]